MVITPICPHSLSFRPIVINADSKVEVSGIRVNEGTTLSIDGQLSVKLAIGDVVKVERHKGDFLVVNNPLRTQWDTLATKLRWAEKPKYNREPMTRGSNPVRNSKTGQDGEKKKISNGASDERQVTSDERRRR